MKSASNRWFFWIAPGVVGGLLCFSGCGDDTAQKATAASATPFFQQKGLPGLPPGAMNGTPRPPAPAPQ